MPEMMYIVKNTRNGSYLMGAERDCYLDKDLRYFGAFKEAKLFRKDQAQQIADSMDFGTIEETGWTVGFRRRTSKERAERFNAFVVADKDG